MKPATRTTLEHISIARCSQWQPLRNKPPSWTQTLQTISAAGECCFFSSSFMCIKICSLSHKAHELQPLPACSHHCVLCVNVLAWWTLKKSQMKLKRNNVLCICPHKTWEWRSGCVWDRYSSTALYFSFFYEFCGYEGVKGKKSMRSYILRHTCDNNVIIGDYMIN